MAEPMLETILEQLEEQLDLNHAAEVEQLHLDTMNYKKVSRIPLSVEYPADTQFPRYPYSEVYKDPEKMLYNELVSIGNNVWNSVRLKDDFPLQIRPNYGIGLIASLFGAEIRVDYDNTPWVHSIESEEEFRKIISHGVPDIKGGIVGKVHEAYEIYKERLSPYPKCSKLIRLTQPDMQGPFCNLQMIRGEETFYDLYDDPDMVHEAMDIITDTMIAFRKSLPELNDRAGGHAHYILFGIYGGGFLLKLDTETAMISEEMYEEFCMPYNKRILDAVGGGSVHFCGGGKKWPSVCIPEENIYSLNFGNPDMQDVLADWTKARDKKISTIAYGWGLPYSFLKENMERGLTTGATFLTKAGSFEEAKQIMDMHRNWCEKNL